jgi:hypothetical protein
VARPNDFSPWNADRGQNVNPMAEKSAKKKPKKAAKADPSVLGNLRPTRPDRLGGDRRGAAPRAASTASANKQAAATKPKAAAAAKPKAKAAAKPKPKAVRQPPRTSAPPAGWQVPGEGDGRRDGGPAELVTTAVQAAGELAQIGLTVGGQILRRAANRLPGR